MNRPSAPDVPDPQSIRNAGSGAAATGGSVAAGARAVAFKVDGSVEGGIRIDYHEAGETPLLLPTPPAPPAHFTGREDELNRLARLLTSGENVAITALQGMGGIGKTALAQKLAERVKDAFPGGVLWWSLGPQPDVITALDAWARHADPRTDLSALPDAESRANVVRSMLANLGTLRVCAIIDDVWQTEAARTLMSAIPPGCPILITTRDGDLAKALRCRVERIDTLNEDEAIALLAKLLGSLDGYEPAARDIAKLTEGLPLALELIAGVADSPADLPALAKKLKEKPALDILKMPGDESREESVEACLALSYTALDADVQRRFRALGVFAPAPFDRAAIAAVWNEDGEKVDDAVRHLTRRNLFNLANPKGRARVSEPSQGSPEYRQHTLLRAYALALLERQGELNETAARHADYYRQFAKEKDWRTVEIIFEQIDWGWRWVQAHAADRVIDYEFAVDDFLRIRGRETERIEWMRVALEQSRASKTRKTEGTLLNNIGYACSALGRKQEALDTYQQALAIRREVGDRWGESVTLFNIGMLLDGMDHTEEAIAYLEQNVALDEAIGHPDLESDRAKLEELRRKVSNG